MQTLNFAIPDYKTNYKDHTKRVSLLYQVNKLKFKTSLSNRLEDDTLTVIP